MISKDTATGTVVVAGVLCIVCSIAVSVAAVALKPTQIKNKALDKKKNILLAAGMYSPETDIDQVYKDNFKARLIEIETGNPSEQFDPETFDLKKALKDPSLRVDIPSDRDLPKIKRRSRFAVVYEVHKEGALDQVVVPVYGKGLWSTLYGFIAIRSDGNTVNGFGFYQHAETPGLGGEVDNPKWKAQWVGKKLHDDQGKLRIEVLKGKVDPGKATAIHQIDGLSGATITTRGVSELVRYWLSEDGFAPYIAKLRGHQGASL